MTTHEHTFSWAALGRIVLLGLGLFLVWKTLGAFVDTLIALILAASLHPLVYKLHKKTGIPMLPSTFLVFTILLIPFILIGISIIPDANNQLPQLLSSIDTTLAKLPLIGNYFTDFSIVGYIQDHTSYLVASSGNIAMTVFSVITILFLTFYFVYDEKRLSELFINIFPYKNKEKLEGFLTEVAKVMGQYIRGNVIISCITFVVIYIGLLALKIPYALPLALFAGVVDLLPLVGSAIGAVPSLLVAFNISSTKGLVVLIIYIVYQQIENAIVSPAIYNKALNLYPSLGFLAVVIGGSSFGILGAFLALPIAACIPVAVNYFQNDYSLKNK